MPSNAHIHWNRTQKQTYLHIPNLNYFYVSIHIPRVFYYFVNLQNYFCILFWYQYRAFFIINYNLTNDCTIISNTIITNNMLLHVSTSYITKEFITLHTNSLAYVNQFILYLLQLAYTATTQTFYYAVQSTFYWSLSFYILTALFY